MIKTVPTLAPNEQFRLDQCEKTIEHGLNTFVAVGRALIEIRDEKLYRVTHKTFEVYCKERWDISRPRAYALIEQANVGAALAEAAGMDLSCTQDISSREAAAVKKDLSAVTEEIKTRVEQGEDPEKAAKEAVQAAKEKAKAEKAAEQAKNDASRDDTRAKLPPSIRASEAAKEERKAAKRTGAGPEDAYSGLSPADRIAELEDSERALLARVAELEAQIKTYERLELMYCGWTEGGWEKVVQAKDDTIAELQRTAQTRIARESEDKAAWSRSAKAGWKEAKDRGYSRDEVIDLG